MSINEIYFDNAATTAPHPEVVEVMRQHMLHLWGNASAGHRRGAQAAQIIGAARKLLGEAFSARTDDVIFTSGGSEANALAVMGAARARRGKRIVVSAIEHSSVRKSAELLVDQGFELVTVAVNSEGRVNLEALAQAVDDDTAVVAIMHANNEVGTVQPIAEAARIIHAANPRCHFHVDTVQSFGKEPVNLKSLGADSIALSGHKFHGPQGVGLLVLAPDKVVKPLAGGGGQERGLRPGTENIAGIAGLAEAARRVINQRAQRHDHMEKLRQNLADGLLNSLDEIWLSGDPQSRLCNIVHLRIKGLNSTHLLHELEARGLLASAGSACHNNKKGAPTTLQAMGLAQDNVASLRLSLSEHNTQDEVDRALQIVREAVLELRMLKL